MDAWTLIVVIMLLVELDQLDGVALVTVAIQDCFIDRKSLRNNRKPKKMVG